MTRNRLLGLLLIVILLTIWVLSRGGESSNAPTTNAMPAVEEPDDREIAGFVTPEGDVDRSVARVGVGITDEERAEPPAGKDGEIPGPKASRARIWLVGRVIDAAGNPVAGRELPSRFQIHQGMFGPTHFAGKVTTDADGRFRQDLDDAWLEEGTPMTFELVDTEAPIGDTGYRKPSYTRDPAPLAARATFVVPNHLEDGEHDLGEAEVRGPVVLVRGRTVDGRGDAVANADVSVRWAHRVTVPPGADPGNYMREIWWMLDEVGARAGEAGTFELVGFAPDAPLRVEAKKDGFLDAEPVDCELGATDVDVVLVAGGRITGRVLVDDGVPRDRFQVEVRVGEGMAGFRRLALDHAGGFAAEGLPPGPGLVSLVLKPDRDILVEIADVGSGTTYRDPRLDPLDLRGAITMATVTVVGADGAPLETAEGRVVGMHFPDTSSREYAPRETPGVLSFLGLGDGLDVQVWATGYRAKVLTGVRGEVEVQLDAGTRVRAELTSTPPLEEGESLRIVLEVEDEYWRQVAVAPIEPGLFAELVASHDGHHQFSLWLEITTAEGTGSIRIQSPEAAPAFELAQDEDPGPQTIVLTEAALAAARENWRRFR